MNVSHISSSHSAPGFQPTPKTTSTDGGPLFDLIHAHGRRVAHLTFLLCREIGANSAWSSAISRASVHHDIGKLLVSRHDLLSEGDLSESGKAGMRRHASYGEHLIKQVMAPTSPLTALNASVCRHHHEHFDGSGYPDGLSGTHIPLPARIVAVTDVFDALTSSRPYRLAVSSEEALRIIVEGCNRQFDPDLVEAFETVLNRGIDHPMSDNAASVLEITEDRWLYRIAAAAISAAPGRAH